MRHRHTTGIAVLVVGILIWGTPQTVTAQFALSIGGAGEEEGFLVLPDGAGGAFASGVFSDTVDFDPGAGTFELTNPQGSSDVFLARYDGLGNLLFAVGFGNAQFASPTAIAPDGSGGVFLAGGFRDTLDIDPGVGVTQLISNGWFDIFVARFDGSGNLVFGFSIGNSLIGSTETATDLYPDGSGGFYMTGWFYSTMDFDPGGDTANLTAAGALGATDAFVARYDASGNYLSAFRFGDAGADSGEAFAPNGGDGFYLTGMFAGTVDFDPGGGISTRTSSGTRDIYVAQFDTMGALVSVISFGGVNGEGVDDLAPDDSGGVFVTGSFFGGADFDPGAGTLNRTSEGGADMFLARYNATDSVVFAHAFGTSGVERGTCVRSDGAGGVYVTGTVSNTIDFDPGAATFDVISNGSNDALLAHYTGSGNFISAVNLGGTAADEGYCLGYGGPEEIFFIGAYQRFADFDLGAGTDVRFSNGGFDTFLLRLSNIPTPEATSTMAVSGNGTVDFGSDVAVCIDFEGVFWDGDVTVERYEAPVQSPEGVDEPVVYESHWRIIAAFGSSFASTTVVRIKLDNLPGGTFPDPDNVTFYKRSLYGAGLLVPVTTTYDETSNELHLTGFESFSEFVGAGEVEAQLPVELSSIAALVDGFDVQLVWSAESETSNAGFEVEHATAGADWTMIAFVEGAGTTPDRTRYVHRVTDLEPGKHRFRLKQIDFDGHFQYSDAVEALIELPGTHLLSPAYPNPFNPTTEFTLTVVREQSVLIELFDTAGRRVDVLYNGVVPANEVRRISISGLTLPSGVYRYRVVGENFVDGRSVLLVK